MSDVAGQVPASCQAYPGGLCSSFVPPGTLVHIRDDVGAFPQGYVGTDFSVDQPFPTLPKCSLDALEVLCTAMLPKCVQARRERAPLRSGMVN